MYMYIHTYGINDMFIHTFIDKLNIQIQIVIEKTQNLMNDNFKLITCRYDLIIFENDKHHKVNSTKP